MSTKNSPGEFRCLDNLDNDEPFFLLKATDIEAPSIVEAWANRYFDRKNSEGGFDERARRKFREALNVAEDMRTWRRTCGRRLAAAGGYSGGRVEPRDSSLMGAGSAGKEAIDNGSRYYQTIDCGIEGVTVTTRVEKKSDV